jgi:hypothetical protein
MYICNSPKTPHLTLVFYRKLWPKLIHEIDSSPFVTTLPFKTCDESNLGISRFCNLDDENLPEPKIWGQQESIL